MRPYRPSSIGQTSKQNTIWLSVTCCARLTQDFSENENQNHADEETGLLSGSSDTSITNNTDGEAGSKTSQTDSQTSTELDEASVQREFLLETVGDEDRHDQTVDTNDTSHNDWNNVYIDALASTLSRSCG